MRSLLRDLVIPLLVFSLSASACGRRIEPADLVLLGGRIVTLDAERPEAQALAARSGRVVAVGSPEAVAPFVGPGTEVLRLDGMVAVPGFIEGHAHLLSLGRMRAQVDLRNTHSFEEVINRVTEAARRAPPGEWIRGRGWHQERWVSPPVPAVEGFPVHEALSRAVPDHPVYLVHASGHACIANARAMELAGIDATTRDPVGGQILRNSSGRPTGILREAAAELIAGAYERDRSRRPAERRRAEDRSHLQAAMQECLAKGITSLHDAGETFETIDILRQMGREGLLPLRLWVMVEEPNGKLAKRLGGYRTVGEFDGHLTVRAIKCSMDGALGSRGAWLLEPYSDAPDRMGGPVTPLSGLEESARLAIQHGFQLCVHAIGDRANRETLDLFERTFARIPPARPLRWRIEHAQHVDPADVPRFRRLGVIAAVQGIHCTSDGPWVPERIGERRTRTGAYPWRMLLDAGVVLVNGTDAPVEDVDPLVSFHASVTRRMADGSVFHPEQRMTRLEALRSYTQWAAFAAFEEAEKGTLAAGKLADITVLSRDILDIPDPEILETRVVHTIIGGRVVYRRDEAPARAGVP